MLKAKLVLAICFLIMAVVIISSCQNEDELNFKRYYSTGSTVYQSHCQNCHATNGAGLGELIPPLTDSAYLKTNLHNLPCIVKNGLSQNIEVKGKSFAQAMPAQADLTPIETAEVLTYIGNSFGNKLGLVDVSVVEMNLKKCN